MLGGKKKIKESFSRISFCYGFCLFNEGSSILNSLSSVHNPKITLNVKMQIQVCAFAIAVDFIKR